MTPRPAIAALVCVDPPGTPVVEQLVLVATGEVVRTRVICVPDPVANPPSEPTGQTPVPSNAPVPSADEIWKRVPLPLPAWGVSPDVSGLTGLPTRLWDPRGGEPVVATVALGAFSVTASGKPIRYEWRMWDPADEPGRNPSPLIAARGPGSAAEPAAAYTYETKGDYTLSLTITWAGTSTFTGPGVNEVVDLGTTTTSASRTYRVIEVRGTRL